MTLLHASLAGSREPVYKIAHANNYSCSALSQVTCVAIHPKGFVDLVWLAMKCIGGSLLCVAAISSFLFSVPQEAKAQGAVRK